MAQAGSKTRESGLKQLMFRFLSVLSTALFFFSAMHASEPSSNTDCNRIITVGGAVTETVFALGKGAHIVATDTTSYYPPEVNQLPKVGYQRALPLEGMLSFSPDCVLANREAGPEGMLEDLAKLGAAVHKIDAENSTEGVVSKINQIATLLQAETEAEALLNTLAVKRIEALPTSEKRALFLMSHGGAEAMMAGKNTAAMDMVKSANLAYVDVTFSGYKPTNPEALLSLNPDVIIVSDKTVEAMGGAAALAALPGIAQTTAGKQQAIYEVDTVAFLGFGPRMVDEAIALSDYVHAANPLQKGAAKE